MSINQAEVAERIVACRERLQAIDGQAFSTVDELGEIVNELAKNQNDVLAILEHLERYA